jgi:hypothetical protein
MKLELKGWKAIAALAIVAAVLLGKFAVQRSTLDTGAAAELKFWLRGEYLSGSLAEVDVEQMSEAEVEAKAEELLGLREITFTKMSARGSDDDIIVKLEIQIAGKDPPDGKRIRYFQMSHSAVTGWRVQREATALSYYLKLF